MTKTEFTLNALFLGIMIVGIIMTDSNHTPSPPVAEMIPKDVTIHGDKRIDPYYWLNEKGTKPVLDYLNAENNYSIEQMKHTERLQDELYSELSVQSSEKALSINKDLAEGYKARALISSYLGRISEAIDMNKRAIELGYFTAESNLALAYFWQGDLSKSLEHHLRGRQSDPYNLRVVYILALAYQALDDYDKLHNLISDAMEKHPDGFELHDILITQYCIEGNWKKARATMERLLLLRPNDNHAHRVAADLFLFARDYNAALDHLQKMKHVPPDYKIALAYVLLKKWDRGWANTLLDEVIAQLLKRIDEGGDVWSRTRYTLAEAYSVMNDKDSSLNWLEKAVDRGWTQYRWIEIDPRFDTIRDDPRYTELIDRMKAIVARERMEAGYTS